MSLEHTSIRERIEQNERSERLRNNKRKKLIKGLKEVTTTPELVSLVVQSLLYLLERDENK